MQPSEPRVVDRGEPSDARRVLVLARGVAGGVLAFLVSFALTYVFKRHDVERDREVLEGLVGADAPTSLQLAGWWFYGAHNVALESTVDAFGASLAFTESPSDAVFEEPLLLVLPIVVLAIAGVLLGWRGGSASTLVSAAAGATVVLGYLPLAVVGTRLAHWSHEGLLVQASAGPDTVSAVLFAAVLYPVVWGALGGVVGGVLRSD